MTKIHHRHIITRTILTLLKSNYFQHTLIEVYSDPSQTSKIEISQRQVTGLSRYPFFKSSTSDF